MPVKNVEKYIKEAIESILLQTHKSFELLILDDSVDNTPNIVKSFSDDRIKYYKYEGNIPKKLNFGIEKSKGEYIARMDGDDISQNRRLETQLKVLHNKNIDLVGCNLIYINEKKKLISKKIFPELNENIQFFMPINTSLPHATMFAKKSIFLNIRYNKNLEFSEDMDVFLKIMNKGYSFYNVQEYLYYYRLVRNIFDVSSRHNAESYKVGKLYLNDKISVDNIKDRAINCLRLALLEYYKGDLRKSRTYFGEYLRMNPTDKSKLRRYLLLSKLHPAFFRILRKSKIPQRLNRVVLKYFEKDMQYTLKDYS